MTQTEQIQLHGGPADGYRTTVKVDQTRFEWESMGKTHVYRRVPIKPMEAGFYHDGFVGQVFGSGVVR